MRPNYSRSCEKFQLISSAGREVRHVGEKCAFAEKESFFTYFQKIIQVQVFICLSRKFPPFSVRMYSRNCANFKSVETLIQTLSRFREEWQLRRNVYHLIGFKKPGKFRFLFDLKNVPELLKWNLF